MIPASSRIVTSTPVPTLRISGLLYFRFRKTAACLQDRPREETRGEAHHDPRLRPRASRSHGLRKTCTEGRELRVSSQNGSCLEEKEMTPNAAPSYVASVLMLYVDLPDTPLRPGPRDHHLARQLYEQGVPMSLVESALLLGSLRRLMRPADLAPSHPFAHWVPSGRHRRTQPLPEGYLDYLRHELRNTSNTPPAEGQKSTFSDALTAWSPLELFNSCLQLKLKIFWLLCARTNPTKYNHGPSGFTTENCSRAATSQTDLSAATK
jgi:hypothetical protein